MADIILPDYDDNDDNDDNESLPEIMDDRIESPRKTYKNLDKPKTTLPILTKFERARMIGVRAQQLAAGASPCIKGIYESVVEVAEAELMMRRIPIIIRRNLPNGCYEDWKIEEFENV